MDPVRWEASKRYSALASARADRPLLSQTFISYQGHTAGLCNKLHLRLSAKSRATSQKCSLMGRWVHRRCRAFTSSRGRSDSPRCADS